MLLLSTWLDLVWKIEDITTVITDKGFGGRSGLMKGYVLISTLHLHQVCKLFRRVYRSTALWRCTKFWLVLAKPISSSNNYESAPQCSDTRSFSGNCSMTESDTRNLFVMTRWKKLQCTYSRSTHLPSGARNISCPPKIEVLLALMRSA